MKIALLGGHGFVGENVSRVFEDANYRVVKYSRQDGFDFLDYGETVRAFKDSMPDIIINCAAQVGSLNYVTEQAADVVDNNMRMLLNIYKAAQQVLPESVLVNPVANCAYPGNLETYVESDFWKGKVHQSVLSYGNVRRMIPVLSECYEMQHGYKSINYLVPNMYGPFDSTDPNKAHALNALIGKFVCAREEGSAEVEVWGSGIAIREWLFAKDFGRVILKAVNRLNEPGFSEPINVGQDFGLSIRELVAIIAKAVEYKGDIIWNKNMPDGAPRKVMSEQRFRKTYPDFVFTGFDEGIQETVKYYESLYPY